MKEKNNNLVLDSFWNDKPTILIGDIHGEFSSLKNKLASKNITDCILIGLGDIGMGFENKENTETLVENLNHWFKSKNLLFIGLRGNHDDPVYFDGSVNLSNFKLVPDYTYMELNGEKWGFVGGAISLDRLSRVEGVSFWKDEGFVLKEDLIQPCDILITHSAPTWIGPFDKDEIKYWTRWDTELWEDCKKERFSHDRLVNLSKPKKLYCGHFHRFAMNDMNGCTGRILDILEFYEHRKQTKED